MRRCLPAERAPHRQEHVPRRPLPVHVNPGGQLPRQRGYSPPHASNGVVVVVVVCTGVVVVVDLDVVLVAGRVVVVCVVVVGRAVVVVRGTVLVVVVRAVVVGVDVGAVVVGGRVAAVVVVPGRGVAVAGGAWPVGGRRPVAAAAGGPAWGRAA